MKLKTKNNIIKKSIKINNKIVADFYYKKNDNSIELYIKKFINQYKKLIKFFNKYPPKITINFIYTRKEMDNYFGKKSPKWLCGMVDNKDMYKIYIFSPLVFQKLTTHKKDEILPTIIHETAHAFVSQINKKCFAWMNEGICQYVENGKKDYKKIKEKNLKWFIENDIFLNPETKWNIQVEHEGYKISYNLVKYILKTKGREKFIQLLKIKRKGNYEKLRQKMDKIVGDMNLLLNNFIKKLK